MSAKDSVDIVHAFWSQVWNAHDATAVDRFVVDDFVIVTGGEKISGRENFKQWIEDFLDKVHAPHLEVIESFQSSDGSRVALGVIVGLVIGKLVGVAVASVLALRLRIGSLPAGVRERELLGAGAVAGIGFTVALFVTDLAFPDGSPLEAAAKVGTLVGSAIAGALGFAIVRASTERQ